MGTYKIGGAPLAYHPRVLLLGEIPQNTQRNKSGLALIFLPKKSHDALGVRRPTIEVQGSTGSSLELGLFRKWSKT
jgi:hypothetical protein